MEQEPTPAWQQKATTVVYLLAVLCFAYIGYAYYTQIRLDGLMSDLFSSDKSISDKAAAELAANADALPNLTTSLGRRWFHEERMLCAEVILKYLELRAKDAGDLEGEEKQAYLRRGLNLEAVTAALSDESPPVRALALKIVDVVGTSQNYQRTRLEELRTFESLLAKFESGTAAERREAEKTLLNKKISALPYITGILYSHDADYHRRGAALLCEVVQDILRGSNQSRIVSLLGRRRTGLVMENLCRSTDKELSKQLRDTLMVSGRVKGELLDDVVKQYASLYDKTDRGAFIEESVINLERTEKVRRSDKEKDDSDAGEKKDDPNTNKIKKLSGDTGENR